MNKYKHEDMINQADSDPEVQKTYHDLRGKCKSSSATGNLLVG